MSGGLSGGGDSSRNDDDAVVGESDNMRRGRIKPISRTKPLSIEALGEVSGRLAP